MYDPQIDKVVTMCNAMIDKHKGHMWNFKLDWGVVEINYPGYENKIEQMVPYVQIRFK